MKIIAITQARYGSTRLPGKVLQKIGNKTLLQIHLERASASKKLDQLLLATTVENEASAIEKIGDDFGIKVYRGSVSNVLDRFYQCAKPEQPDYVVRITSDCPLIDAELMDDAIEACIANNFDYCTNTLDRTYPDGMDVEVMKFSALERAWKEARLPAELEHVTPYIRENSSFYNKGPFTSGNVRGKVDYSAIRLTVDHPEDFEIISTLVKAIGDDKSWIDYVDYLQSGNNAIIK